MFVLIVSNFIFTSYLRKTAPFRVSFLYVMDAHQVSVNTLLKRGESLWLSSHQLLPSYFVLHLVFCRGFISYQCECNYYTLNSFILLPLHFLQPRHTKLSMKTVSLLLIFQMRLMEYLDSFILPPLE